MPDPSRAAAGRGLGRLTAPETIAIVGLSSKRRGHGYGTLRNLVRGGFAGTVYGVHPSGIDVDDTPVFPRLTDLPSAPDVVLICTPNDTVVPLLDEMGAVGAHAAIVFGSGFDEVAEGEDRAELIRQRAAEHDIAIVGPNCLGLVSVVNRACMTAASLPDLEPGPVGVVSQSGSGCILLTGCGRLRFSHVISSGNETVTGLADYLELLVADETTRVIGVVAEGIGDPARVLAAADAARDRGVPIVALKLGRTERGAERVRSHTGAIAGDAEVYEAFARRAGIASVRDYDELVETLALLSAVQRPAGGRVAFVGLSGGEGALIGDVTEDLDLPLADLSADTRAKLTEALPAFATVDNPLDATGPLVRDPERFRDVVGIVAGDPGVGCVTVFLDAPPNLGDEMAAIYADLVTPLPSVADAAGAPVVLLSNHGGAVHARIDAALRDTSVPILRGTRPGLTAVGALLAPAPARPGAVERSSADLSALRRWRESGAEGMAPPEVVEALAAAYGLSLPQRALADDADGAAQAAARIGYPVVLKTAAPAVVHKSDAGGVATGLASEAELREAYADMVEAVARHIGAPAPEVIVEEMVAAGVEAFVGARTDEVFGPVIAIGSGGVLVELYHDVALALLPLAEGEDRRTLERTRLARLLAGFRGRPPADVEALLDVMRRVGDLIRDLGDASVEIDLNPVIVLPEGAKVVDLRVVATRRRDA